MTGYRSSYFRHDCQTQDCYIRQLPNWDDLIDCFPGAIRPTDIDGMVEIRGNVLFLEEKRAGQGPDEGQRRALRAISRRPCISTLFMRPSALHPTDLECLIFGQGEPDGWRPRSRDWVRDWLADWAQKADQYPYAPDVVRLGGEAA